MKSLISSALRAFNAAPFSLFLAASLSLRVMPPPSAVFHSRRGFDAAFFSSFFLVVKSLVAAFSASLDDVFAAFDAALVSPPDAFAAALALASALLLSFTLSAYVFATSLLPRSCVGCCSLVERWRCCPISFLSLYSTAVSYTHLTLPTKA